MLASIIREPGGGAAASRSGQAEPAGEGTPITFSGVVTITAANVPRRTMAAADSPGLRQQSVRDASDAFRPVGGLRVVPAAVPASLESRRAGFQPARGLQASPGRGAPRSRGRPRPEGCARSLAARILMPVGEPPRFSSGRGAASRGLSPFRSTAQACPEVLFTAPRVSCRPAGAVCQPAAPV